MGGGRGCHLWSTGETSGADPVLTLPPGDLDVDVVSDLARVDVEAPRLRKGQEGEEAEQVDGGDEGEHGGPGARGLDEIPREIDHQDP